MSKKKDGRATGNPVVRFRLPPVTRDKLKEAANRLTGGDVSALLRDLIERGNLDSERRLHVEEFWPIIALVSAILETVRVEGRPTVEHVAILRVLYELLLERCVYVTGLED